MTERKLQDRFNDLEERLRSVESLSIYGISRDLKFFIFDYFAKDELLVRDEVLKLLRLNPDIIEMNLYDLVLGVFSKEGYLDNIFSLEKTQPLHIMLEQVLFPLLAIDEQNSLFFQYFKNLPDNGKKIILITGVGSVFPIIRGHMVLNELHSIFSKNSVVMFYPGKYENKHKMSMSLFDKIEDTNYYRGFPIVEREGK